MEFANIDKEIIKLLGIRIKCQILNEWITELQTKPEVDMSNLSSISKAIIEFIARKDVDLYKITESEIFEMTLINQEFQVKHHFYSLSYFLKAYKLERNRLFQIIDVENISENYENRHLDSNGRTLKFKITDGFMIYQGIEEQKLNLNKIITRYKHSINGKPQPFNLNNLQKMKLLVKTGTIFRRNVLLFKDNNTTLLEEYDDLFVERMVPQMKIK